MGNFIFIGGVVFYGIIIMWIMLEYRKELKLERLRGYDQRCRVEAMRKERNIKRTYLCW